MKRNNENFLQSADVLFMFWLQNLKPILMECKDTAYGPREETNTVEI